MRVVCLAGDGIGPELMAEAERALAALDLPLRLDRHLLGGAALRACGDPLPEETLAACRAADAVLKAPVGDPEFDGRDVRPEQGTLRLRRELDVYANLRPAIGRGADLIIVRELLGGLYYGASGRRGDGTAYDTCEYRPEQVERVARRAFELARSRRRHLTSIDKANVLETSRLWRRVVSDVATAYPDVKLDHMLVDNAAMQLVQSTARFDVIVTDNMFGDILSDLTAGITGGLGLGPTASLGDRGPGIFEPVHGSAPDIAGKGIANPAAMLRSVSLMLAHGLGWPAQAKTLEDAVNTALRESPTPDQGGSATTRQFGDVVVSILERSRR
jgi:3-isopropylmalate dehydrogenase